MSTYAVQAGRCITKDNKPYVTIHRCDGTDPVAADELTHVIAHLLNKREEKNAAYSFLTEEA